MHMYSVTPLQFQKNYKQCSWVRRLWIDRVCLQLLLCITLIKQFYAKETIRLTKKLMNVLPPERS